MTRQEFEKEILRLAYETEFRITVPAVAYYFSMPSRDARDHLNHLIDDGLLELDSDRSGNLFYRLPNQANTALQEKIEKLIQPTFSDTVEDKTVAKTESVHKLNQETYEETSPTSNIGADVRLDRIDSSKKATLEKTSGMPSEFLEQEEGVPQIHYVNHPGEHRLTPIVDDVGDAPGTTPVAQGFTFKTEPKLKGKTAQIHLTSQREHASPAPKTELSRLKMAFDAEVPTSFFHPQRSRFIVQNEAACDPARQALDQQTMTFGASCDDKPTRTLLNDTNANTDARRLPLANQPTYPVPYSPNVPAVQPGTNPNRYYDYEPNENLGEPNPSHYPLMAGLFSLCIPGAGQFYNGQIGKGFVLMLISFISWIGFAGWIFHVISILDAIVVASKIKNGTQDKQLPNPNENQKLLNS